MVKQRQLAGAFLFPFFVLRGRHLAGQVTAARWRQPPLKDGPRWRGQPDRYMAVPQPLREMSLDGEGQLDDRQVALSRVSKGGARER